MSPHATKMPPRNLGGPTLHRQASVSHSCYAAAMACLASL